jgi:two-component system phosphate regulon response regulator PhoB
MLIAHPNLHKRCVTNALLASILIRVRYAMSRATILIADDSADIRRIMRYLLNDLGFAVVEAADGNEAVRLARQCQPALILLDLCMPGIDGWEVATQLRADPALEEVPILAMTAYNVTSAIRAALLAGCQQVVIKPFDLHDISRMIAALMVPHSMLAPHYA